jgi:hypothetical protein
MECDFKIMCSFSSSLERSLPHAIADHSGHCDGDAAGAARFGSAFLDFEEQVPARLFGRRALLSEPGNRG